MAVCCLQATEHPLDGAIESQRELYSGAVSTEDKAEDLASLLVLLAESGRCQEVMDEYSKYCAEFAGVSSLADAKAFNSAAKAFADQGDFEQALKQCNAALTAAEALPLSNPCAPRPAMSRAALHMYMVAFACINLNCSSM